MNNTKPTKKSSKKKIIKVYSQDKILYEYNSEYNSELNCDTDELNNDTDEFIIDSDEEEYYLKNIKNDNNNYIFI